MSDLLQNDISAEAKEIIEEEERFLRLAAEAIIAAVEKKRPRENYRFALDELRDEVQSSKTADKAALVNQFRLLLRRAEMANDQKFPDILAPYFAHMRLETEDKIQNIFLGHQTFIDSARGIYIIDWKRAPLARVFYTYQQGDDYEMELPGGRNIAGLLLARRTLAISDGLLVGINDSGVSIGRMPDGAWVTEQNILPQLGGGERSAVRGFWVSGPRSGPAPDISALLDQEQYELLTAEPNRPLLVLGGAGTGKTTVILHRLAAFENEASGDAADRKSIVIVPEVGLRNLSERILLGLGLTDAVTATFDEWAVRQYVRISGSVPMVWEETPASVIAIKRCRSVLGALSVFITDEKIAAAARLRRLDAPPRLANELEKSAAPLLDIIKKIEDDLASEKISDELATWIAEERERVFNLNDARLRFWGDDKYIKLITDEAGEFLPPSAGADVLRHNNLQAEAPAAERYSHITDHDKLLAADGVELDRQSPEEEAGTIDVEDIPVMLEILRLKTGELGSGAGVIEKYNHIVIDEAQEFSPTELNLLSRVFDDKTIVTVAGDEAQHVDPTSQFSDWQTLLADLSLTDAKTGKLNVAYRSPRPIIEFSRLVLGELAPTEEPEIIKEGTPPVFSSISDFGRLSISLYDGLLDLVDREPDASIAVIAATAAGARELYEALQNLPRVGLALNGDFRFQEGVNVADVASVKGLEFDYVIVPDLHLYDGEDDSRRSLYVAVTRAIHQLWLLCLGPAPRWIAAGLDQPQ